MGIDLEPRFHWFFRFAWYQTPTGFNLPVTGGAAAAEPPGIVCYPLFWPPGRLTNPYFPAKTRPSPYRRWLAFRFSRYSTPATGSGARPASKNISQSHGIDRTGKNVIRACQEKSQSPGIPKTPWIRPGRIPIRPA